MDNNGEAMMGNNFIYIFGLLLLFGMMNGGFGFGGNRGPMMPPDLVTTTQMQQDFGVWGEKKLYGRTYMGTMRKTFIFNEKGILERIIDKVDTKNHTSQIL